MFLTFSQLKRLFTKISTENKLMLSQMSFRQLSIESDNIIVAMLLFIKGIRGSLEVGWVIYLVFHNSRSGNSSQAPPGPPVQLSENV